MLKNGFDVTVYSVCRLTTDQLLSVIFFYCSVERSECLTKQLPLVSTELPISINTFVFLLIGAKIRNTLHSFVYYPIKTEESAELKPLSSLVTNR